MRSTERGGDFSYEELDLKLGLAILRFAGKGAKAAFENEAGGHRVQQVSPTEKKGRVHSSTVRVTVLDVPTPVQISISRHDIRVEAYTGGGPGGQNRNRNATNIRIKHLPTGIEACANTKSRKQNEKLAMELLVSRLLAAQEAKDHDGRNNTRRAQAGNGNRASQKIRTVAYQRGTVKNHLTGKSMKLVDYERGLLERIH